MFLGALCLKLFHFTPFGRKWLQTAPEAAEEALPNGAFNSYYINVAANAWSTKCRLIVCMSAQIMSNLRDESIKLN
jgi:hypothetical protein